VLGSVAAAVVVIAIFIVEAMIEVEAGSWRKWKFSF
jgi:hypothetical protein